MAVRSLSENEINELEMLRKKARDKDDVAAWQRASAMLMIARGATKASAALVHGVSVRSVFGWQEDHRSLGCEGLWDKDRPGRPPRLAKAQMEQLAKVIEAGPEEAGLNTGIWTGAIVADLIKEKFNVQYSVWQVRRILHKLKFSVQFPKKNSQRPTMKSRRNGLTTSYPRSTRT